MKLLCGRGRKAAIVWGEFSFSRMTLSDALLLNNIFGNPLK